MSAPERIWAWLRQVNLSPDHVRLESVWTKHPRMKDGTATEYVRADVSAAAIAAAREEGRREGLDDMPEWLTNCTICGRVVDTREESEGGDGCGCEYGDVWVCSPKCADVLHPPPDFIAEAERTFTEAEVAAILVRAWGLGLREGADAAKRKAHDFGVFASFGPQATAFMLMQKGAVEAENAIRALTPPADLLDRVKGGE